mgnify:CR=1 FL=1
MSRAANRGGDPTVAGAEERVSPAPMCRLIGSAGTKISPVAFERIARMNTSKPAALAALPDGCSLSLRTQPRNLNHHLWWNNGTWWLNATVHYPDHTKQRLRLPLETRDIWQARQSRDRVFAAFHPFEEAA